MREKRCAWRDYLAAVGGLRDGISVQTAADVLFTLNSPEFFLLLARDRAWQPDDFEQWLADAWRRLLLPPSGVPSTQLVEATFARTVFLRPSPASLHYRRTTVAAMIAATNAT